MGEACDADMTFKNEGATNAVWKPFQCLAALFVVTQ